MKAAPTRKKVLKPKNRKSARAVYGIQGVSKLMDDIGAQHEALQSRGLLFRDLVDRRSAPYRFWRALVIEYAEDAGGAHRLTTAKLRLIQHLATLSVLAQMHEERLLSGKENNEAMFEVYLPCIRLIDRLSRTIGLNPKRIETPTLNEYLDGQKDKEDAA